MSLGQPWNSDRAFLRSSPIACNITDQERDRISTRRNSEVILEDYALVRSVHFLERSDTNDFHGIDCLDLSIPLRKTELHLIGRAICIAVTNKAEHPVGNRDAGEHHRSVRTPRSEVRDLPDIGKRAAGSYQP